MNKKLSAIFKVLHKKNYFILFLISGLLYGIVYALMTNLIDLRYGLSNINVSFDRISILFFTVFSLLGGMLISLQVFAIKNKQKSMKSARVGFLGAFLSFFNVTCPFCKPLLLSLLGFSGSLAILKYGLALAFVSLILLLVSIYLVASSMERYF